MAPPFNPESVPTDAELRVAQAQLVGWLEGLFHGIQATIMASKWLSAPSSKMPADVPCRLAGGRMTTGRHADAGHLPLTGPLRWRCRPGLVPARGDRPAAPVEGRSWYLAAPSAGADKRLAVTRAR